MNLLVRWLVYAAAGVVLIGILSGFFWPSIESTLTLPQNMATSNTNNTIATSVPTASATAPASVTPVTPQATVSMTPGAKILAQDKFQRGDQALWGTATDGQSWNGDANSLADFSITANTGSISRTTQGQGFYNAILGPATTDAEVVFSGSISSFNPSNLGSVLHWTDKNDYYKAYIDGAKLVIIKNVAGMPSRLNAVAFTANPGTTYSIRFRIVGTNLSARAWQTGSIEPTHWMVTTSDDTLHSGFAGLRLLLDAGVMAKITMFTETTVVTS